VTEVILAAMQPLPGERINSAAEVARSLAEEGFQADRLTIQMLPADMRRAGAILVDRIRTLKARAVIIAGQCAESAGIGVEAVARNLRDFGGVRDGGGNCPVKEPIVTEGPVTLTTSLPAEDLVAFLLERQIEVRSSKEPGAHLTNHVLYEVLFHVRQDPASFQGVRVGALSLPLLPEQARREPKLKGRAMDAAQQLVAVRLAVEFALRPA
jgi:pyroglutamyl-peptidase